MKKAISFFLLIALSFSLFISASASEIQTTRSINGLSVSSTVSDAQISDLPQAAIDRLQEIDATVVSVSTEYFDFDSDSTSVTRAVMPESDFQLTVVASKLSNSEKEADELDLTDDAYEFMAVGRWYVNPLFELTDCIGITWSDEFTLYYDEGYTYSHGSDKRYDTMTLNKVTEEQGFAYDVDLQLFDRQNSIVIIGRVYKDDSTGNANVCASYGHVIIAPSSIEVSFVGGAVPINMSVGFASQIQTASPDYAAFDY